MASSIGNNWSFNFIGVYCSQQKDFAKKKWNPNYFGVRVFFFFFEKLGLCDLCLLDQINMGHTIVFSTTIVTCFVEGTNHCTKPDF